MLPSEKVFIKVAWVKCWSRKKVQKLKFNATENNLSPVKNWERQNGREHCCPNLVGAEDGNHQNDGDDHDHNEDEEGNHQNVGDALC